DRSGGGPRKFVEGRNKVREGGVFGEYLGSSITLSVIENVILTMYCDSVLMLKYLHSEVIKSPPSR
ncbi:MAG: hypothetical protein AB7E21_13820, partial [Pseudodonghicola sp.]